jgi:hypothetical protein
MGNGGMPDSVAPAPVSDYLAPRGDDAFSNRVREINLRRRSTGEKPIEYGTVSGGNFDETWTGLDRPAPAPQEFVNPYPEPEREPDPIQEAQSPSRGRQMLDRIMSRFPDEPTGLDPEMGGFINTSRAMTEAALTKGGTVGDIAAETVGGVGGSIVGALAGGLPGGMAGGAGGSAANVTIVNSGDIITRGDDVGNLEADMVLATRRVLLEEALEWRIVAVGLDQLDLAVGHIHETDPNALLR